MIKIIYTIVLILILVVMSNAQLNDYIEDRIESIVGDSIATSETQLRSDVSDSITVSSSVGDIGIETTTVNGYGYLKSVLTGTSYYTSPHPVDSTMVNGLISDSLDVVYLPIMLWTASDVADTSLNDAIGTGGYNDPPTDRSPGFYSNSTTYIRVLRISYYHVDEIDSIRLANVGKIDIGGEDGSIRMGIAGFDSVEVTDDFPFAASPGLSMTGASEGIVNLLIEIKTTDGGSPFMLYPICLIGYYKLR